MSLGTIIVLGGGGAAAYWWFNREPKHDPNPVQQFHRDPKKLKRDGKQGTDPNLRKPKPRAPTKVHLPAGGHDARPRPLEAAGQN